MSLTQVSAKKSDFKEAFSFGGPSGFEDLISEEPEEVK